MTDINLDVNTIPKTFTENRLRISLYDGESFLGDIFIFPRDIHVNLFKEQYRESASTASLFIGGHYYRKDGQ